MKRFLVPLLATVTMFGVLLACSKAPYTKRPQYILVPDGVMRMIGKVTYTTMISESRVAASGDNTQVLRRVGGKISRAANQPKFDWEYKLIRDDTENAWCLPGGKIAFYTGILPLLENEAGMAFVMGHEAGHAVAHHSAERMTQQLTLIGGLAGLDLYLANSTELSGESRALILAALGVGAEVGIMLPFSRKHEAEADVIGMMYMAKAGYPPAESIKVWKRFDEAGGASMPTFLSTHPSHEKRQENLREWLPRARKRYERNAIDRDTREPLWGPNARGGNRSSGDDGSRQGKKKKGNRR